MCNENLDFRCQHLQWQHKIPDRKINFCCKFVVKNPLLMLTLEILSLSIHSLKNICTTCWWNLNKILWRVVSIFDKTKQNKTKNKTKQKQKQKQNVSFPFSQPILDKALTHFLEDVSVAKTIVDAKLSIWRLPYFIISISTLVRQV